MDIKFDIKTINVETIYRVILVLATIVIVAYAISFFMVESCKKEIVKLQAENKELRERILLQEKRSIQLESLLQERPIKIQLDMSTIPEIKANSIHIKQQQ